MRRPALLFMLAGLAAPIAAQTNGSITGHVRQREAGTPIPGAQIGLDGRWLALSDSAGFYRIREVRSGWHLVTVRAIGFETVQRDSVLVRAGQVSLVNFSVDVYTIDRPIIVEAFADSILDPALVATVQRISGEELRRFPVTTLDEAVALSAGAVGESYRGGRLGQQAFVLDGLGVKNQLDASTGPLGVRIPPDILTEASLVTNGFSARYGQALSGLINVVTRDGGERWTGRAAFESDRPLWGSADLGLDRSVVSVDGPLGGGAGLVAVLDAEGRLDADPVNAPPPPDARDPRNENSTLLPHNSGERYDAAMKLRVPLGGPHTLRLFALRSVDQRLLYAPAYKYDDRWAPARRVTGDLLSAHLQRATNTLTADLRAGYFTRDFLRGTLTEQPPYRFGAITGRTFRFVGEDLARAQDTAGVDGPIAGLPAPDFSDRSPWGVPAFFLGAGSNGDLAWNRYRELRGQADFSVGGPNTDVYFGGEVSRQHVRTFQRVLGYLPVGDSVPPPVASDFSPTSAAGYVEAQAHGSDFVVTVGLRYDQFDPGASLPGTHLGARRSINPRFGFSTVLKGATVVVSWGRFSQAPDHGEHLGARECLQQAARRPRGIRATWRRGRLDDLRQSRFWERERRGGHLRPSLGGFLGCAPSVYAAVRDGDRDQCVRPGAAHPYRPNGRHDQSRPRRVPPRLRPAPQCDRDRPGTRARQHRSAPVPRLRGCRDRALQLGPAVHDDEPDGRHPDRATE